jgi:hypothetical protein
MANKINSTKLSNFRRNIIELSLKTGDVFTYETSINQFFKLIDVCLKHESVDYDSSFRFSVNKLISDNFELMFSIVIKETKSTPIQSLLVHKTGDFLKLKALENLQTTQPFSDLAGTLVTYATSNLEKNSDASVFIISLFRQLAQKGIYSPPNDEEKSFFKHRLIMYPNYIKILGQEAIKKNSSDYLFRCLEDLGFLGCTAVKNNHYQVIIQCLQSIVQLGREARAANIKCFWTHCALEAADHAHERMQWMVTWLPGLDEKDRELLISPFEIAFSRMGGKKVKIAYQQVGEKLGVAYAHTDEPHIEGYAAEGFYRKVDYTDNSEIKEFKIF